MKKRSIILFMMATILLSGVAGYGGATLAGYAPGAGKQAHATDYQSLAVSWDNADYLENTESAVNSGEAVQLSAITTTSTNRTALTVPEIAKSVANTVVEIETEQMVTDRWYGQRVLSGAGSGVIISTEGYIITCNHVIEDASKITVRLKNGTTYNATLVGRDVKTDLAVIKIEAANLQAAKYGNTTELVVGELAVAVGNPLGELGGTVTEGIISALNRDINIDGQMMNLLQTSAAVNPGNSGGGLFNTYGELIGVVNAKSGGSNIEGIGFAVPAQTVKAIAEQLVQYGYVQGRVDFGITLVDISDMFTAMRYGVSSLGVYVGKTDAESGLQAGDRIVSVNSKTVTYAAEVKAIYDQLKVGDTLNLVVSRNGKNYNATVTLKQARF